MFHARFREKETVTTGIAFSDSISSYGSLSGMMIYTCNEITENEKFVRAWYCFDKRT